MTASQAAEVVLANSDEAGLPGPDSEYGVGILDLGRVMNRCVPGIVDAAITDQRFVKSSEEVQVTVQNRGTTVLVNTLVEVQTPAGTRQFNATTIAPGTIQTFSIPMRPNTIPGSESVQISSRLTLGTLGQDVTPNNNRREDTVYVR
jgi:hypothetical protein